jgi:hypothetical protein
VGIGYWLVMKRKKMGLLFEPTSMALPKGDFPGQKKDKSKDNNISSLSIHTNGETEVQKGFSIPGKYLITKKVIYFQYFSHRMDQPRILSLGSCRARLPSFNASSDQAARRWCAPEARIHRCKCCTINNDEKGQSVKPSWPVRGCFCSKELRRGMTKN